MENHRCEIINDYERFYKLFILRQHVHGVIKEPKRFANPLTGNYVLKTTYNRALREKQRREKVWQETLRKVDEMSRFMEQKVDKKVSNTIKLPEFDLTLFDTRNYEIDLLIEKRKARFTRGSKFVNLFKNRKGPVRKNWESVSVTVDAVIRDDSAPISIKDRKITLGPYEDKMPIGLSIRDKYQFLMFMLLKDDRFSSQSGEHVSIGGVITKLQKLNVADIRMGDTTYERSC